MAKVGFYPFRGPDASLYAQAILRDLSPLSIGV